MTQKEKIEAYDKYLGEAIELAEDAMAYVPEYFIKKWKMDTELNDLYIRRADLQNDSRSR